MNTYTAFQIISDIFGMFYISRFMNAFISKEDKKTNKLYMLLYLAYPAFTISSSFIGNIPLINMFSNLTALFLITFCYKCNFQKKVITVGIIFFIMLITDISCATLGNVLDVSLLKKSTYTNIINLVLYDLIIYTIAVLAENLHISKENAKIPNYIWLCFAVIPLISIIAVLLIIQIDTEQIIFVTAVFIILLMINVVIFFLYDSIVSIYETKISNVTLNNEKEYYYKQCLYMQESEKKLRSFRHDIKNQLELLKDLSVSNDNKKLGNDIKNLENRLKSTERFSNTENIVIDSILNLKYTEANKYEIKLNKSVIVPKEIDIDDMDLMVILGNSLDNAIEATKDTTDKYINITINFKNNMMYIKIENTYSGKLYKEKGKLLSTKTDKTSHGYGLSNIKDTVERYSGNIKIGYTSNIFYIEVILYLKN